jgi:curved DNA-binding protein CbpA
MTDKNFYEILGVNQNATRSEIRKSYLALARGLMTDRWKVILQKEENFICTEGKCGIVQSGTRELYFCSGPNGLCARTFNRVDKKWKQILEAYETLSNLERRREYDAEPNREPTSSFNSQKHSPEEPNYYFEFEKNRKIKKIEKEFEKWSALASELNPNLWSPYRDWKQKAESLTTLEKLKEFSFQLLSALQKKIEEEKEFLIRRIEEYSAVYVEEGVLNLEMLNQKKSFLEKSLTQAYELRDLFEEEKDFKEEIEEIVRVVRRNLKKFENYWNEKTTDGKINGKTFKEFLEPDWKKEILQWGYYGEECEDLIGFSYDLFVTKVDLEVYLEEKRKKKLAIEKMLEGTVSEGGWDDGWTFFGKREEGKICEEKEMKLNLIMKNTRKLKGGLLITLKIT